MTATKLTFLILGGFCVLLTVLSSLGLQFEGLQPIQKPVNKHHSKAKILPSTCVVVKVFDGDTIACRFGHAKEYEKVRLLGIDAPETEHSYKNKTGNNQPYSEEAKAKLEQLVSQKTVVLEYDERPVDRYGRKLAFVYQNKTDKTSINQQLLEAGFVKTLFIPPNTLHQGVMAQAESHAQRQKLGLWRLQ